MAILSLYVLYVVAINVFLSTSLFGKVINGDPDTIFISFERGWSVLPGHVHARRLVIRSRDSHVAFVLRIEKVAFDVSFTDLALRKKFHVSDVVGSGVTFGAQQLHPAPVLTREYVEALPPIPGFGELLVRPVERPNELERWDDRHYNLWAIELEKVTAEHVRSVWIDTLRFEGDARIEGGFLLRPIRAVRVGPIHTEVSEGTVRVLGHHVIDALAGSLDFRASSWDPRVVEGTDLLHHFTLSTELHGRSSDLATLPPRFTEPATLGGRVEVQRLALRIQDGIVVAGTHIDATAPGASIDVAPHRVAGDLAIVADASPGAEAGKPLFQVNAHLSTREKLALRAHLSAAGLDLYDPLAHAELKATLETGPIADSRALDALLPAGTGVHFDVLAGKAKISAHLAATVDARVVNGELAAQAHAIGVRGEKLRVRANLDAKAAVARWRLDEGRLDVKSALVTAEAIEARLGDTKAADVHAGRAEIHASVKDLATAAPSLRAADLRFVLQDGILEDARALNALLPEKNASLQIESGSARASADISVSGSQAAARGSARVAFQGARARVARAQIGGDFVVIGDVKGWAPDRATLDVSGSRITMRNVAARGAAAQTTAWSGEVSLVEATLGLAGGPHFDGLVDLRADNAKPVLAVIVSGSVPEILVDAVNAPELSGQARLAIEKRCLSIHDAHVRGGETQLTGDYVAAGGHKQGLGTVAHGPLSVGLRVDDKGTSVHVFGHDSKKGGDQKARGAPLIDDRCSR